MGVKRTLQSIAKTLGLTQAAKLWLSGEDMSGKTPDRPNKPYKQVELVFRCVEKLISSITSLPLVLSTVNEEIIESGPAYDLLFNSSLTFEDFITQTVGHYALTRDVFWVFTETAGMQPTQIQVVSGTQMHPITSDGTPNGDLVGWEYRAGNYRKRFALFEVHQIKNFNPYDKFHGIGPISAASLSISQAYQASLFNESALANGAEPGAILMLEGKPDERTIRLIRSQFEARHQGAKNAKRTAALAGIKDIKTVAMSMVDMQMAELRNLSDIRICSAFGVPPAVVGLVTEAQYAHGPAQQDFAVNTMRPLASLIAGHITKAIISRIPASKSQLSAMNTSLKTKPAYKAAKLKAIQRQQKIFAWFDVDSHPTIQAMNREVAKQVLDFTKAGVKLNNLIIAHDLPYEVVPWGDDWWIGMGQVPARYALEAGVEGITGPSLPEGSEERKNKLAKQKIEKADEAQKLRIWRNWVVSWAGIEREYQEALRKFFLRQQRELINKLQKALPDNKVINKAETDEIIARVVFDLKKEGEKITVINRTFFGKAVELGIRQIASELGITGNALNQFVETTKRNAAIRKALTIQSQKIASVNKTTQRLIANQIREGLENGEGLNDLTRRIKKVLGSNRSRALSIARTQTAGAVGSGRHVGMKQAGAELKIWLTSGDSHVRPTHVDAGKRYADGIPVDEPFVVGGDFLMHPGDPAASPANVINCRCVELAAKAKGKAFSLSEYAAMKFFSYADLIDLKKGDNKNV